MLVFNDLTRLVNGNRLLRMFRIKDCITKAVRYTAVRHLATSNSTKAPIRSGITLAFGKYLLLTNTVSSGALMFIGDICQQEIEYRRKILPKRYDYARLARMVTVGLALGPLHHYFYVWLARIMPARNTATITKKIMLDQFVMSPLCIVAFFYGMGLLEMRSLKTCTDEIKDKYAEVYLMDWIVWPPTQFINFYYVPVKYQVFYINAVTMFYNIFLSYIKHREHAKEHLQKIA